MKQQYVLIHWRDATMNDHEQTSRKIAETEYNLIDGVVAGFLVKEDKEKVVVGMDWFDFDDQFRVINTYPKSGIKKLIIKDFPIQHYEKTKTK